MCTSEVFASYPSPFTTINVSSHSAPPHHSSSPNSYGSAIAVFKAACCWRPNRFPATTTRLAMFDWPYIRHFSCRSSHVCTYVDSFTHSDTHSALSSLLYEFAIGLNIYVLPPLSDEDHSPISRAVLKPLSLSLRHRSVLAQSVVYHPFSALSHQRSSSMID